MVFFFKLQKTHFDGNFQFGAGKHNVLCLLLFFFFFILSAFAEQLTVLHGCYGSCNPWGSQILDFLFYSAEQKRGVCHSSGRFGLLVFDGHIDNLLQVLLWSFFCPVCGQTDLSTTLCVMDDIQLYLFLFLAACRTICFLLLLCSVVIRHSSCLVKLALHTEMTETDMINGSDILYKQT